MPGAVPPSQTRLHGILLLDYEKLFHDQYGLFPRSQCFDTRREIRHAQRKRPHQTPDPNLIFISHPRSEKELLMTGSVSGVPSGRYWIHYAAPTEQDHRVASMQSAGVGGSHHIYSSPLRLSALEIQTHCPIASLTCTYMKQYTLFGKAEVRVPVCHSEA
jgi:hypothetical protein